MGLSPVPAVKDLLDKSGLKLEDFELIEVNEAFAAQYLGVEKELGLNREITNVNGSGIGLGHPVGSTGCRIMVTLLYAMKKRGKTEAFPWRAQLRCCKKMGAGPKIVKAICPFSISPAPLCLF